ncbi:hypothetical protein [Propionispora sp. 2/2-37]|uniref:hypothetical protein n=1 Tax=Propionispora sp. 2/2-37 TaxID=1677858 RepID=UPI0006BB7C60|nr:hypothetical protein [Propionispora sp. 2/2-37]
MIQQQTATGVSREPSVVIIELPGISYRISIEDAGTVEVSSVFSLGTSGCSSLIVVHRAQFYPGLPV